MPHCACNRRCQALSVTASHALPKALEAAAAEHSQLRLAQAVKDVDRLATVATKRCRYASYHTRSLPRSMRPVRRVTHETERSSSSPQQHPSLHQRAPVLRRQGVIPTAAAQRCAQKAPRPSVKPPAPQLRPRLRCRQAQSAPSAATARHSATTAQPPHQARAAPPPRHSAQRDPAAAVAAKRRPCPAAAASPAAPLPPSPALLDAPPKIRHHRPLGRGRKQPPRATRMHPAGQQKKAINFLGGPGGAYLRVTFGCTSNQG